MKAQDEDRIRKQLDLIAQWRASGLPKAQWAAQHGVELKSLSGWLTYESRWKARLSGQPIAPRGNSAGFVAVRMAPSRVAELSCPFVRNTYPANFNPFFLCNLTTCCASKSANRDFFAVVLPGF